jgi:putative hydrolase of the HAD superfamily
MIKAIIFDYGNVISLPDSSESYQEMEKLTEAWGLKVPADVFPRAYDAFSEGFDRGEYDGAAMYAMHLEAAGYAAPARDKELMRRVAQIDMVTWQYVDEEVTAWVKELRGRGFKIGILSNMPHEFLDNYEDKIEAFAVADYACFSCRVKLIKPERAIYEHALSRLGVEACEAVFFDDIQKNIDAANALGIRAFLWNGLEKAKENLHDILMKENTLSVGMSAEKTVAVDSSNTAASIGSGLLAVFATPAMIALMECAAAEAVSPALEEGFSTVGAEISVKHHAATPPGMTARAKAVLTAIDGKKLVFNIEAFDDAGKIGDGTHTRYIIENKKFLARAEAKLTANS